MDNNQVSDIFQRRAFPGKAEPARLLSTHISWVILTPDYAFKIKKPVRFSFLDFSTPARRSFFCREEVRLNRRLAPDTYLDVLPIGLENGLPRIGKRNRSPLDYAVWMRREDNSKELDILLRTGNVVPEDMKQLAHRLAVFHKTYALQRPRFDPADLKNDFADLFQYAQKLADVLGSEQASFLGELRSGLPLFMKLHGTRLRERARTGFFTEGHGDLHTRNIFLTDPPVLFDCIEFNPQWRRLDVLNELAFLAMDLDCFNRPDLGEALLRYYREEHPCIARPEDEALFLFFKAYRANVRLKVTLLGGSLSPDLKETVKRYWELLEGYWRKILV